ncbi:hypothetical protein BJV78DRAFT_1246314 [Lactifluus subvellereus]|nr:hypothetical protein BJV78DRAFT_1246314 [Lactifluus subvellereus]
MMTLWMRCICHGWRRSKTNDLMCKSGNYVFLLLGEIRRRRPCFGQLQGSHPKCGVDSSSISISRASKHAPTHTNWLLRKSQSYPPPRPDCGHSVTGHAYSLHTGASTVSSAARSLAASQFTRTLTLYSPLRGILLYSSHTRNPRLSFRVLPPPTKSKKSLNSGGVGERR